MLTNATISNSFITLLFINLEMKFDLGVRIHDLILRFKVLKYFFISLLSNILRLIVVI